MRLAGWLDWGRSGRIAGSAATLGDRSALELLGRYRRRRRRRRKWRSESKREREEQSNSLRLLCCEGSTDMKETSRMKPHTKI